MEMLNELNKENCKKYDGSSSAAVVFGKWMSRR